MPTFPKLKKGETFCLQNGSMYALKWVDKRDIHILSSVHADSMAMVNNGWKVQTKPAAVIDYNKNMRLVDKCDMQIAGLSCMRRSFKWYKKYFFHIVDIYRLNAHHLYKLSTGSQITLGEFIYNVSTQLLEEFGSNNILPQETEQEMPVPAPFDLRKHSLTEICRNFSGVVQRRKCVVCAKTKKIVKVRYECSSCKVALCLGNCFIYYHENITSFEK